MMIPLPYGGKFNAHVKHIQSSGRDYIIQGQTTVAKADHPKTQLTRLLVEAVWAESRYEAS
jgi:hypothetical protein